MKRVFFIRLTFAVIIIFLFAGLEFFSGFLISKFVPKSISRKILKAEALNELQYNENHFVHPYLAYDNTPNLNEHGMLQTNSQGFRNIKDIKIEKSKDVIRILVKGGSTTYSEGVKNIKESWPFLLEKKINDTLKILNVKKKVEVINGGLRFGTSAEMLSHYIFKEQAYKPDITIIHLGGNDLGPLMLDNYLPDFFHWRKIKAPKFILKSFEFYLIKSKLFRFLYSLILMNTEYKKITKGPHVYTENTYHQQKELILNNIKNNNPTGYERNLDNLFKNLVMDSSRVIFFDFYSVDSTFFSKATRQVQEIAEHRLKLSQNFSSIRLGLLKNTEVAKNKCAKYQIPFLKIKEASLSNAFFVDQCHLDYRGQIFKCNFLFKNTFELVMNSINN